MSKWPCWPVGSAARRRVRPTTSSGTCPRRRCARWWPPLRPARRLGQTAATAPTVLGDGAEWIWNLADQHFAGAAQVLDIYHAVEHLAAAGRQAVGDGEPLQRWLAPAREQLLGDGYEGVCAAL